MIHAENNRMLLSELLDAVATVSAAQDIAVSGVSEYSEDVVAGDVFIALSTLRYCQQAIDNGAVAIICQSIETQSQHANELSVPVIECRRLPAVVNDIVCRFYGRATKQIPTIAITGTDGKTSVAHLVAQALEHAGDACGLIGTLGYGRLPQLDAATHTTPPRARLAREYAKFNQLGCGIAALEASSHGIHQQRLQGLTIHTAVLTNITRDHLDYHKTLEAYIQAKADLFFNHAATCAVLNLDDELGRQWSEELQSKLDVVSYSLSNECARVYASGIDYSSRFTTFQVHINNADRILVHTTLLGEFNVLNLLAVAAVLVSLKKSTEQIATALNKLDAVPGRMQCVGEAMLPNVIVDYAHTPAALFAAIRAVRQHCQGKLICVFGCGGDRDQGKRPLMGEVASTHCDYVVVTSDNPRHEVAETIIQHITNGCVADSQYISIVDRQEAITHALRMAGNDDAVLIAGKGHEQQQYIGDGVFAFDDVEVAQSELQRMAHGQ